jgi:hypothetical protein
LKHVANQKLIVHIIVNNHNGIARRLHSHG